jgi:Uncharacterized protein encoded in toxicity protection region of plasmid R478, contains von Willebrand factor (vWF) domain
MNIIAERPIREANEAHVALSLILDVSTSMHGEPMQSLNTAVNLMIQQMKNDEHLKNIVDLSIFVFGALGREVIYQGFRPIADCDSVSIQATDASTYVVDALERAVQITRKRCGAYDRAGGSYKPWIALITDGEFHDKEAVLSSIGNKIREQERKGKLQFFGLGVEGYNRAQLERLTNDPTHVIDAKSANFVEFLSWIGRSLKAVSSKEVGSAVALPPLQFTV